MEADPLPVVMLTMNMMIAPGSVEYRSPSGPKNMPRTTASPTLFVGTTTMRCGCALGDADGVGRAGCVRVLITVTAKYFCSRSYSLGEAPSMTQPAYEVSRERESRLAAGARPLQLDGRAVGGEDHRRGGPCYLVAARSLVPQRPAAPDHG